MGHILNGRLHVPARGIQIVFDKLPVPEGFRKRAPEKIFRVPAAQHPSMPQADQAGLKRNHEFQRIDIVPVGGKKFNLHFAGRFTRKDAGGFAGKQDPDLRKVERQRVFGVAGRLINAAGETAQIQFVPLFQQNIDVKRLQRQIFTGGIVLQKLDMVGAEAVHHVQNAGLVQQAADPLMSPDL